MPLWTKDEWGEARGGTILRAYCILRAMTGHCPRDKLPCMLTPCPECGHTLWSEVRSFGAFRFVVYFDNDLGDTYAERVLSCPGCGAGLGGQAHEQHGGSPLGLG